MARDYGTVSSGIWTGKTGKALRGNHEAQIMALYLMTCSHAQMTGIYYLPMMYAGYETGLGVEGASKGLRSLLEGGFCAYDEETEYVFVFNLAREQVGPELKGSDNRVKGIKKQLASCPQKAFVARFYELYGDAYEISADPANQAQKSKPLRSPLKAPSKPGTGTGTGTEEISAAPTKKTSASAEPAFCIPTNTGEEFPIFREQVAEFAELYPAVDVPSALREMRGWCVGNPTKRKTKAGVLRFVTAWLSKEQNSGGRGPSRQNKPEPKDLPLL